MKRKNIIVTGANGYLGSQLVRKLSQRGDTVWAVIRSEESNISSISGLQGVHLVVCPMEKIESLSSMLPPDLCVDTCYHLAWYSGKKLRNLNLKKQVDLISQSLNLMRTIAQMGCRRFIGTGSILETNSNLPLAYHPNMVYAITKDCTNKLLLLQARELGIGYCWCRLCGLYGGNDRTGNLVSYAIENLKAGKSPEFSDGSQPYSFIHVEDCADALIKIGDSSNESISFLTISGPECQTIRQYMETIGRIVSPDVQLKFGARPDDEIRYQREWFDNKMLKEKFDVKYKYSFSDGVMDIALSSEDQPGEIR